jgi:hypothetical protein
MLKVISQKMDSRSAKKANSDMGYGAGQPALANASLRHTTYDPTRHKFSIWPRSTTGSVAGRPRSSDEASLGFVKTTTNISEGDSGRRLSRSRSHEDSVELRHLESGRIHVTTEIVIQEQHHPV